MAQNQNQFYNGNTATNYLSNIQSNYIQNSTNKESNFRILSQETKINELETKLIVLEQNNHFLLDQLKNYERNFEMQISKFSQITESERENRQRIEKIFTIFSDQTTNNTSELKSKVNFIQEIFEKEEKWKFEQRQKDFEVYKGIISTITEKISETVKAEVDMRFKADMDNKIYTQNLGNKLMRELDFIRREIDEVAREGKDIHKESSKECAERTVNLSRYVDQMLLKATEEPLQNNEKMKSAINKLTDQVKNNLQFQNDFNKILDERVNLLTESSSKEKERKIVDMGDLEKRTDKKFKDFIFYIENIFKVNSAALNERIDTLSNNTDKNINFLANQLIDSRKKLITKIHEVEEKSQNEFFSVVEDLEQIVSRINNYEVILVEYDKINVETKNKINKSLAEFQSKYETKFINEKMQRELENEDIKDLITKSNNDIIELGEITNNQLEALAKNFEKDNNDLMYKFNQLNDKIDDMNKNNYEIFDGLESNLQKIINNNMKTDVENLMTSMLNEFDERDKIEKLKFQIELKFKNSENNFNNELDKIDKIISEQIDSIRQSMQNGFDSVYEKFNVDVEEKIKMFESELNKIKNNQDNFAEKNKNELNSQELNNQNIGQNNNTSENLINNEEFKATIESIKNEIRDITEKFSLLDIKNENDFKFIREKFEEVDSILSNKKNISDIETKQKKLQNIANYEAKNTLENLMFRIEIENIQKHFTDKFVENDLNKTSLEDRIKLFSNELEEVKSLYNGINEASAKSKGEYLDIMESKLEKFLEKIKKDNLDLWNNAVQEMSKYSNLDGN